MDRKERDLLTKRFQRMKEDDGLVDLKFFSAKSLSLLLAMFVRKLTGSTSLSMKASPPS